MHPPSPTAVNGSAPHLAGRIFLTGDTAGVLCILRGQHAASSPVRRYPLDGPRRCRCLHDGIALSTGMFFPYRPDNRKRYASTPAVRRYPRPDSSVNRRSSGSTAPQATVAFRHGVVIQERLTGAGLTQRTLYCRSYTLPVSVSLSF